MAGTRPAQSVWGEIGEGRAGGEGEEETGAAHAGCGAAESWEWVKQGHCLLAAPRRPLCGCPGRTGLWAGGGLRRAGGGSMLGYSGWGGR